MRIQFVAGHGQMGGGEHMLLRMAQAAQELGYEVVVLGPSWGTIGSASTANGLKFHALSGNTRRLYGLALTHHLRRRRDSLVWANGAFPALSATMSADPVVVHLHQVPSSAQAMALAMVRRRAAATVVPSQFMATQVPGSRVLLNWTQQITFLPPVPAPSGAQGGHTIAYLGRLSLDKGVDVLADAASMLTDPGSPYQLPVRLLVAGDYRFVPTPAAVAIKAALANCGARVQRIGWVDPLDVFGPAHVVVVPSRNAEAFGLVAAEAMAAGRPVVATRAGGLPEVLGPEHPWLANAGDTSDLATAIHACLTREDKSVVASQRRKWEQQFSPTAGQRRLAKLLAELFD